MGRRKGVPNKVARGVKQKGAKKDSKASDVDRNRASPSPVIKLARTGLTDDQRDMVVGMGQGSFLDIKCEDLHNPLVSWFARCYEPSRRAFVIPCRGVIPLSEESVEQMTGLPRGPLKVNYAVDFELEEQISNRLFPGKGSRPSASYVAKRIAQHQLADDTFKELWMIHTVSTIVAPTLDNKISNKCYSILSDIARAQEMNLCKFIADQLHENFSSGKFGKGCLLYCMLRYITAINTNDLSLELEDTPYAINSWTTIARDCVAALDTQEYDSTKFGVMQLRDEFKDVLSREMGLFGGPDGFESWMQINIHPTSTNEQRKRAHSLMLSFASTVNGALSNLVQGLTESVSCERCASSERGVEDDTNQDKYYSGADADGDDSTSKDEEETEAEADDVARVKGVGEPSYRGGKQVTSKQPSAETNTNKHAGSSNISPTSPVQAGISFTPSPPPIHSQINVPSDTELFGSDGSGQIGGYVGDSQISSSQFVDDEIRGVGANLVSNLSRMKMQARAHSASENQIHDAIKLVVAKELNIPVRTFSEPEDIAGDIQGGQGTMMEGASASLSDIGAEKMRIEQRIDAAKEPPIAAGSVVYNEFSTVVDLEWPVLPEVNEGTSVVYNEVSKDMDAINKAKGAGIVSDPPKYNPLHKRKQEVSSNLPPPRKSPRLGQHHVGRIVGSSPVGTQRNLKVDRKRKISSAAQVDGSSARAESLLSSPIANIKEKSYEQDGSSARTAVVLSPTVDTTSRGNVERDGSSARTAVPVSPTVSSNPGGSGEREGTSARSAFVLSPTVSSTPKPRMSESKMKEIRDGKRISSAIPISPTVTEAIPEENKCTDIIISPRSQPRDEQCTSSFEIPTTVSPIFGPHLFSRSPIGRSPMSVPLDVVRLVKSLSDSVNKQGLLSSVGRGKPLSDGGSSRKRKRTDEQSSSGSKMRDNRLGMFTPPPFNLLGSSQESSSTDEVIDAVPLSWVPSQDDLEGNAKESTDSEIEMFQMSTELQDFVLGKIDEVSDKAKEEWHRYEEHVKAFSARQRALREKAKPGTLEGVRSATPKVVPHKTRVKRPSRFKQSPYGAKLVVKQEHEDLYNLVLKHKTVRGKETTNLKSFQVILYKNSWAYTQDLADSIFIRGELSNHCMEVGIEYLQNTNMNKEKMIMSHQLTKYVMDENWSKPMVVSTFKRTKDYSFSVMKQIHFPVFHEIEKGQQHGNHWYSLCLNIEAERFEALDSLRGEGNMGLIGHASGIVNRVKQLWATYYQDSKIQIQNYELKIIDVPKQHGNHDCGFHVLYNIENWDGENIPLIGKDDVQKLRKIFPYNWANADFNQSKNWRWHLENNM